MPPTLKPSPKPDSHRDDSITSQLSTGKFQFKAQLTSLYMVSTPHKLQLNPNRFIDHHISYASEQLAPSEYWTANYHKIFTLQMNFLRPSVFHLQTDDSNPNFQSVKEKRVYHERDKCLWEKLPPNFTKKIQFSN